MDQDKDLQEEALNMMDHGRDTHPGKMVLGR